MAVGAMIPDWAFLKELKRMDPMLTVQWETSRQRWEIYRKTAAPGNLYSYKVRVMTISNEDGSYRPLDMRTIRLLQQYDNHTRGAKNVINEIMDEQSKAEEETARDQRREIDDMTREELLPQASRDAEQFGASNVPKEDLARMMVER